MTHHATEGLSFSPPSDVDLAYLAGLLDGEGHFGTGARFKASGRNRGIPALRVSMVDRDALDWLLETFSGTLSKRGRSARGRVVYEWVLTRQEDLRYLLPRLLPHLKIKGLQAWALLRVVETLRAQPKYTVKTSRLKAERSRRRLLRLRWRYEVATAQGALRDTRRVLMGRNPPESGR